MPKKTREQRRFERQVKKQSNAWKSKKVNPKIQYKPKRGFNLFQRSCGVDGCRIQWNPKRRQEKGKDAITLFTKNKPKDRDDKGKTPDQETKTIISSTGETSTISSTGKKGLNISLPKYTMNLSMGFKDRQHDAMTPYTLGSSLSKKEWRKEEKRPMKKIDVEPMAFEDWKELNKANILDRQLGPKEDGYRLDKSMAKANEPTKDGVSDKEKEDSQRNENHFEISFKRVDGDED